MARNLHIALSVADIADSVADYNQRLGQEADIVVAGEYALWRLPHINFSIRKVEKDAGTLRHLGWEDDAAIGFQSDTDVNGILWEHFTIDAQLKEIRALWPHVLTD